MAHVLVSILTYNGGQKTLRTIADVVSQKLEDISMEVILIDNFSTNDILQIVHEHFPSLRIVRAKSNLGFSGGNNIALDEASELGADFLFVLNDDLQLTDTYVKEMVTWGADMPDAAVMGSTIKLPNGHIQAVSGYIKPRRAGLFWKSKRHGVDDTITVHEVDAIQGSAFMLTKRALERGFHFDERLFFGGEEYDMTLWVKAKGLKCYVVEHVEVIHDTNQAGIVSDRWCADPRTSYYTIRNSIFVNKKYSQSEYDFIASVILSCVRYLLKGMLFALRGRPDVLGALIAGIKDGLMSNMGSMTKYSGLR